MEMFGSTMRSSFFIRFIAFCFLLRALPAQARLLRVTRRAEDLFCEVNATTGLYGLVGETLTSVEFGYQLRTRPGTTLQFLEDEVLPALELALGNELVAVVFPDICGGSSSGNETRKLRYSGVSDGNVLNHVGHRRRLDTISTPSEDEVFTGISIDPPDVPLTDRQCPRESFDFDRCDIVRGELILYSEANVNDNNATSRHRRSLSTQSDAVMAIQQIIESGVLNDAHVDIASVVYVDLDSTVVDPPTSTPTSAPVQATNIPTVAPSTTAPVSSAPTPSPLQERTIVIENGDDEFDFFPLVLIPIVALALALVLLMIILNFVLSRRRQRKQLEKKKAQYDAWGKPPTQSRQIPNGGYSYYPQEQAPLQREAQQFRTLPVGAEYSEGGPLERVVDRNPEYYDENEILGSRYPPVATGPIPLDDGQNDNESEQADVSDVAGGQSADDSEESSNAVDENVAEDESEKTEDHQSNSVDGDHHVTAEPEEEEEEDDDDDSDAGDEPAVDDDADDDDDDAGEESSHAGEDVEENQDEENLASETTYEADNTTENLELSTEAETSQDGDEVATTAADEDVDASQATDAEESEKEEDANEKEVPTEDEEIDASQAGDEKAENEDGVDEMAGYLEANKTALNETPANERFVDEPDAPLPAAPVKLGGVIPMCGPRNGATREDGGQTKRRFPLFCRGRQGGSGSGSGSGSGGDARTAQELRRQKRLAEERQAKFDQEIATRQAEEQRLAQEIRTKDDEIQRLNEELRRRELEDQARLEDELRQKQADKQTQLEDEIRKESEEQAQLENQLQQLEEESSERRRIEEDERSNLEEQRLHLEEELRKAEEAESQHSDQVAGQENDAPQLTQLQETSGQDRLEEEAASAPATAAAVEKEIFEKEEAEAAAAEAAEKERLEKEEAEAAEKERLEKEEAEAAKRKRLEEEAVEKERLQKEEEEKRRLAAEEERLYANETPAERERRLWRKHDAPLAKWYLAVSKSKGEGSFRLDKEENVSMIEAWRRKVVAKKDQERESKRNLNAEEE